MLSLRTEDINVKVVVMISKKWSWVILLSLPWASVKAVEILPEFKVGYFYPTDDNFRDIYSGGAMTGLEFNCQAWGRLYSWIGGSYFTASGHSTEEHNKTFVTIVPVEIGLKYLFPVSTNARMYFGIGAAPTYLHTQDDSDFVIKSHHKWGIGGIVKAGAVVNIAGRFFLDFYGNYSFTKISFNNTHGGTVLPRDADISGLTFGVGFGYRLGGPMKPSKSRASSKQSVFIEGSAVLPNSSLEDPDVAQEVKSEEIPIGIQNDESSSAQSSDL